MNERMKLLILKQLSSCEASDRSDEQTNQPANEWASEGKYVYRIGKKYYVVVGGGKGR